MKIVLSRKYDNYILFFSLVGVLFLLPFVNAMPLLRFALVGQYTFVMLYLVFSARHTRALYLVDMAFVVPTLIATWLDSVYQNDYTFVASYLSMMIFFLYLQYLVIRQMIHAHKVDTNTIFGAMNIYLVAGLIWAYAFILLNHFDSSAFHLPNYDEYLKRRGAFHLLQLQHIDDVGVWGHRTGECAGKNAFGTGSGVRTALPGDRDCQACLYLMERREKR